MLFREGAHRPSVGVIRLALVVFPLRCLFDARIRTDPFELPEYCRRTLTHFFWERTLKN